ncbi:hypothetical protein PIB30_078142 [Stylosanthes scabra]|uniref:Uncharacterized protein n=1 Tax=Stylosanthes scabra TaxID=79078 RepID=A0ABU6XTA2_9FABA|nr:hypothetical protein [Stylosanthes scabra]
MTRGDQGRGRGNRGRGTGRRGRPKKRTNIPLDLGEPAAETSAPTPVPVVPTLSLAEGGPTIRMIPTPGSSRVHSSSDTTGTRSQRQSSAQTSGDHDDDGPPPGAPDLLPWPPVHSTLPEGEEEDIALEEELARQAGRIYLHWDGVGIRYGRAQPRSPGSSTITTGSLCPSSVWPVMRWSVFGGAIGGLSFAYSAGMRAGSIPLGGREPPRDCATCFTRSKTRERLTRGYEMTCGTSWSSSRGRRTSRSSRRSTSRTGRPRRVDHFIRGLHHTVELGRTPTHSEVFARTHTRKEDQLWVDKRSADVNEAFLAELKRLQAERQALMEAGCPEPPPIDEGALWTHFAGGCKRGRIYGMGVVPSHQYHPLFSDDEDADTASGPPDLRERVVLLNREISQQAEANARRVAALESTVQTQSQEVFDL